MSEVALYHRIYTHVPADPGKPGGGAYRLEDVDAEAVLGTAQVRRLDALLASIVPPPSGRAWAICRFAGERYDYACLAVSQSAEDAIGRSGVLTHARLAEVPAGTAMLDLPALAEVAQAASEAGSLDTFARRLRELEPAVAVAPWSAVNAEPYERRQVSAVVGALLAGIPQPDQTIHASFPENGDRLRMLVNVWPLLPVVFQRALVCSLDAREGARVNVAFSSGEGSVPRGIHDLACRYVDWVLDRPDDARRLIESMPAARLLDFEQELNAAQESPMPKPKGRTAEPRPPQSRGTLDPQLVEFLNDQIEASQASIYDWLETALRSHNISADAPRTAYHRGVAARGLPPNVLTAVGAIAVLALLGAGWMWMRASRAERRITALEQRVVALSQGTGVPLPPTAPTDTAPEPAQDPLKTPESVAGQNWPERFQWVVENRQREIVPAVVGAAKAVPSARLSAAKQRELQRMVDVLLRNEALVTADRRLLRAYLFELIASERVTGERKLVIDGAPADVPASVVTSVKDELRIGTASNDPENADLQSEVVLRWIAQQR